MRRFLFVVGQARSGTTALVRVVGAHDQIAMGIERFKWFWTPQGDISGFGPDHFTRERFFDFDAGLTNLTPDFHKRYRAWYDETEKKYDSARYVGEKITQPFRLQALAQQFPNAFFICIVRDVFEVAHSWQARADDAADLWNPGQGAIKAVDAWNTAVANIARCYHENPGRVMIVDHSQFFGAQEDTPLEPMMRFLDLETDDSLRAAYEAARRKYMTSVAEKRRDLPPDVVEHIHATTRPRVLQTMLNS